MRGDAQVGIYRIFAAEPRGYKPDNVSRARTPNGPLTRRLAFWSAVGVPLVTIVFLGSYLGGAAAPVANALTHAAFAPFAVFALRVVTCLYFLPLAFGGVSPSPLFAGLAVYLIAGFALLIRRKSKLAVIVLLLPLLCTIPLSIVGLRTADGQVDKVKEVFSKAVTTRVSERVESVTAIDYRFVVFDASGAKATVATVVTTRRAWGAIGPDGAWQENQTVFKEDYAVQMVRRSSGDWQIASLKEDFHPGYEP